MSALETPEPLPSEGCAVFHVLLSLSPCLTFHSSGAPLVGLPRVHIGLVPCRMIVVVSFSSPPKGLANLPERVETQELFVGRINK